MLETMYFKVSILKQHHSVTDSAREYYRTQQVLCESCWLQFYPRLGEANGKMSLNTFHLLVANDWDVIPDSCVKWDNQLSPALEGQLSISQLPLTIPPFWYWKERAKDPNCDTDWVTYYKKASWSLGEEVVSEDTWTSAVRKNFSRHQHSAVCL